MRQECPTKLLKTKAARNWLAKSLLGPINRLELDQLLAQWELLDKQLQELEVAIGERQAKHVNLGGGRPPSIRGRLGMTQINPRSILAAR